MFDVLFAVVLGFGFFISLGAGFALGTWAYAKLYADFINREEAKRQRAISLAKQEQARRLLERKDMVTRVRHLMAEQGAPDDVVSEEIERVLGTGPGN